MDNWSDSARPNSDHERAKVRRDMSEDPYIPIRAMSGQVLRVIGEDGATLCVGLELHTQTGEVHRFVLPAVQGLPQVAKVIDDLGTDVVRAVSGDPNVRVMDVEPSAERTGAAWLGRCSMPSMN